MKNKILTLLPLTMSLGLSVWSLPTFAEPTMQLAGKPTLATTMIESAQVDLTADTVTFPLHKGALKNGQVVWYILTDVNNRAEAKRLGLEYAPSLTKAGTAHSTRTAMENKDGSFTFEAGTVDFSPKFALEAGVMPNLFPPRVATPGSVGDADYSPFVRVTNRNGLIYNAPVVAFNVDAKQISFCNGNVSHDLVHDKVVSICPQKMQVTLKLTRGFASGREVVYISTDANETLPATMEESTYAPAINDLKGMQVDQSLYAFVNGQTGVNNPQRQGFLSALSGEGSPFNILANLTPAASNYSPLWDVEGAVWSDEAVQSSKNVRLMSDMDVERAEAAGQIHSLAGGALKTLGLLVNCPVVGFLK
jgi:hypothetical protein